MTNTLAYQLECLTEKVFDKIVQFIKITNAPFGAHMTDYNTIEVTHKNLPHHIDLRLELYVGNKPVVHYKLVATDHFNSDQKRVTATDASETIDMLVMLRNVVTNFIAFH